MRTAVRAPPAADCPNQSPLLWDSKVFSATREWPARGSASTPRRPSRAAPRTRIRARHRLALIATPPTPRAAPQPSPCGLVSSQYPSPPCPPRPSSHTPNRTVPCRPAAESLQAVVPHMISQPAPCPSQLMLLLASCGAPSTTQAAGAAGKAPAPGGAAALSSLSTADGCCKAECAALFKTVRGWTQGGACVSVAR